LKTYWSLLLIISILIILHVYQTSSFHQKIFLNKNILQNRINKAHLNILQIKSTPNYTKSSNYFIKNKNIQCKSLWKHVDTYFLPIEHRINLNYFSFEKVKSEDWKKVNLVKIFYFCFIMIKYKYRATLKMSLQSDFSTFSVVDFTISPISNFELNLFTNIAFPDFSFRFHCGWEIFFCNVPSPGLLVW